jgi:chaperonin GroES
MAKAKRTIGEMILVKPEKVEEKTLSGIIIPESAKEKPSKGTVMAVGSGGVDFEIEVAVGDVVLYGKHAGTPISHEDENYLVMHQRDILLIV